MEAYRALRGQDELGGFVYNAIVETLANAVAELGFEDLRQQLQSADFLVEHLPKDDDGPDWESYIHKEVVDSGSGNCMDVSWFFLEYYLCRRMLGQLGYFSHGSEEFHRDPWYGKKEQLLDSAIGTFKVVLMSDDEPSLRTLLLWCVWASSTKQNADGIKETFDLGQQHSLLLVDNLDDVESAILPQDHDTQTPIIIILGGCGLELLSDLRLAAFLADRYKVELHIKSYPCFENGVTRQDIDSHIDRLHFEETKLGQTLRDHLDTMQIYFVEDDFYTSPLEFSQAPDALKQKYSQARLVIIKGDNNYRRLLGDRQLPLAFPFAETLNSVTSTPVLALRACRTPLVVGLASEQQRNRLNEANEWFAQETFGLVQYSHATTEGSNVFKELPGNETSISLRVQIEPEPMDDERHSETDHPYAQPQDDVANLNEAVYEMNDDDFAHPLAQRRGSSLDSADYNLGETQQFMDGDKEQTEEERMAHEADILSQQESSFQADGLAADGAEIAPGTITTTTTAITSTTQPLVEPATNDLSKAKQKEKKRSTGEVTEDKAKTSQNQTPDQQQVQGPSSKQPRTEEDHVENDDALQNANDLLWDEATLVNGGLDMYLEEIGTKDPNRPPINVKLPQRALSAFEYFCQTRTQDHPDALQVIWVGMTKSQKSQFETVAQTDKTRYEKELIAKAIEVAKIIDSTRPSNQ